MIDKLQQLIEELEANPPSPQDPRFLDLTARLNRICGQPAEQKYRSIFENIQDIYLEVDLNGQITEISPSVRTYLGHQREDLLLKPVEELFAERDEKEAIVEILSRAERVSEYEIELTDRTGRPCLYSMSASLLRDASGVPWGIAGLLRCAESRREYEELYRQKVSAEASSSAKTEFLANMSHEIRTPLNAIIGMTELGLETRLSEEQQEVFETISQESTALMDIVDGILDLSKVEAGKYDLESIPFQMRLVVEELGKSYGLRAQKKGLEFIVYLSPDFPSRLMGDPVKIRQVLNNLIGNSLKFTEEGEIIVHGKLVEDRGDWVKVRFEVKDTGIGMSASQLKNIWKSFTQADSSMTRKYGGTGLGTTLAREFVHMMDGEIGADSALGEGSRFWFEVMLKKQPQTETQAEPNQVRLKGLKALVVDDRDANRHVLMGYLRYWGTEVLGAASGEEALAFLGDLKPADRPHMLIFDIQMPGMDGFALSRRVRAMTAYADTPILVTTTAGMKGDAKKCLDIGINGYMSKPVRKDDLYEALCSMLGVQNTALKDVTPLVTRHTIAEARRKDVQVLVVEDYPTNRRIARSHLESADFQVTLAENGAIAVEKFRQRPFSVILMDIQMPVMDGFQATAKIRALEEKLAQETQAQPRIPILAMTAHAMKGYKEECLKAGMDDYISKPLQRSDLIALVDRWCNAKGQPQRTALESSTAPQPPSPPSGAPMNFDQALAEFEGDSELLAEVIEGFIQHAGEQLAQLGELAQKGELERLAEEAHGLKGGALNLTAMKLGEAAAELENLARSGRLEEIDEALALTQQQFEAFKEFSKLQMGQNTTSSGGGV